MWDRISGAFRALCSRLALDLICFAAAETTRLAEGLPLYSFNSLQAPHESPDILPR